MLTIWKRVFITCLGFVAVMPHPAQPQVSFPEVMQVLRGGAPAHRSAPPSTDVGSKTLAVEEKQVSYSFTPSGLVRFSFDEKDYRNTYMLDCKKRQFRWVENFRLSTEEVTDNNAGAEWKPITPNSTISNAVHEVACPHDLAGKGGDGGNEAETNAQEPSFDCSQAKSWSEKTVCNNPTAAALDLQVSRLYNTARAQATDTRKVELKKAQLEWLRTRETCEQSSDTTECLLNVYHDRIAELRSVVLAAGEVSTAIADGYTVPKLATITLATDTREEGDLDSFLGIWEYSDTNSKEDPRYFKVLRVDAHQFWLIEGSKNVYVNDKDKIRWFDRSQDTFEPEPPTIYLQPSEGKLVGQFVSGSFRPTQGIDFTYRLTLEKMSPNTLRYSVWVSQDGEDGRTETFEATKMAEDPEKSRGPAEHSERRSSSSSTGSAAPADRIQVQDGSTVAGQIVAGGKVSFKSSLGKIEVNVKDIQNFSGGKLYLADGTVLAGTFAGGAIELVASVGTLQVPADHVLSIVRSGQSEAEGQGSSGGTGALSREQAASKITDMLLRGNYLADVLVQNIWLVEKETPEECFDDRHMGGNGWGFDEEWPDILQAVRAGFFDVKYVRRASRPGAICIYCDACTLTILPEAQKYFKKERDIGDIWDKPRKEMALRGFDGVSVNVSGLTQPAMIGGRQVIVADFTYELSLNPLGKALRERSGNPPRKGRAAFVLYDNGWRVEEKMELEKKRR